MLDTRFYADKVRKKYKTRNPYDIADDMSILIHYMDLGKSTRGLCHHKKRIKQIFLHEDLKEWEERFVLAHEIGHLVMHPNHNAPFLQTTFFSRSRYEIEANKFASELIISDADLKEYRDYTIGQIAGIYGLPVEIIELRLK